MNRRTILCTALVAASHPLLAQEPGADQAMPNPKHPQHEALLALAGTWETTCVMAAMPDAGLTEAMEFKGIETAELLCGGIWLKSTFRSTWMDQPVEGVLLVGYDPFQESYVGVWVGSMDDGAGAAIRQGSYDQKTKTWAWRGDTAQGPMRNEIKMIDTDHTVETCYMTIGDKEQKFMEVRRTRINGSPPTEVAQPEASPPGEHQTLLHADAGTWNAAISFSAPGMEASKDTGIERIRPICNGRWMWSEFEGSMAGMPFTGHTLYGYDTNQQKYVSFWIDSTGPVLSASTGTFDPKKGVLSLRGTSTDMSGNEMATTETITRKGADQRVMDMEFKTEDATMKLVIQFDRAKNAKK